MIIAGRTETSDMLSGPVNEAINKEKITDLISELKRSPAGLSEQIRLCISYATAYHHAGTRANFADRKSTRLNSSHPSRSRMPSSA